VKLAPVDKEFALAEYHELWTHAARLIDMITQTERFAVLGAAGAAAFSVSNLTDQFAASRAFVSALPFVVVSLAGLRCLTFYLVLRLILGYLRTLETALIEMPDLGFQRRRGDRRDHVNLFVEIVSGAYWVLAVGASLVFWVLVNQAI
jgi:hypothetical protein